LPRRGFPRFLRRRGQQLLLVALVPALLAGCTAGPSTRPPVVQNDGSVPPRAPSTRPAPLPGLEEPGESAVVWGDCDSETRQRLGRPGVPDTLRFTCAKVTSTLDAPDLPGRGTVRLAVLKVGSGTIPLTVVNDIDGEPGTLFAARLAGALPPELLQRFSLIGVDRRGTGQSDPVRCVPTEVRSQLLDQDPAAADLEPVLDAARTAGQQCTIELENQQPALDSWRAAGDLEEVRDQLGMSRLNALSRGEGSKVLTAYATRFTRQVGRFVLDGIPDPSLDAATVLDGVAAGAQSALDAFGTDCAARGCPLGGDARAAVTAVADRLRAATQTSPDGLPFGPGLALHAVANGLAQRERWPELADALAAARGGDIGGLAVFVEPMLQDSRQRPSRLDGALATKCNDTATRLPADQIGKVAATLRGKYPVFGGLVAQELAWCSPWPVRREALPAIGAPGAPPILVTSTAADPVTPEQGTSKAAEQMPSAVQLAWQGAGHGALTGSPCVTEAVRGFLLDGTVPHDGTLCPA
jgi:pimeloyl-ACP methyl ester carboxylesterase